MTADDELREAIDRVLRERTVIDPDDGTVVTFPGRDGFPKRVGGEGVVDSLTSAVAAHVARAVREELLAVADEFEELSALATDADAKYPDLTPTGVPIWQWLRMRAEEGS